MAYYKANDSLTAMQRYHAKLDAITIKPRKDDGERIRSAAAAFGFASTTQFIMAAIDEYIKTHKPEKETAQEGHK